MNALIEKLNGEVKNLEVHLRKWENDLQSLTQQVEHAKQQVLQHAGALQAMRAAVKLAEDSDAAPAAPQVEVLPDSKE